MNQVRRRLAAVLHADVVGYSRLMEEDETSTLHELQHARRDIWEPTIRRHAGRMVSTAGDAVLIETTSAVSAVACAIDLQRATIARGAALPAERRLRLRIGINLGDVVVQDDGDLFGEGVNLAQRLEALAEPDGILVTQPVRDQVNRKLPGVRFVDAGEHKVKNIVRPVHAWRVQFSLTASDAARAATPGVWVLVSRDGTTELGEHVLDVDSLTSADGIVIGRHSRYCAVIIAHDSISRRHARLRGTAQQIAVEDLDSTNGTFVATRRAKPFAAVTLKEGARLRFGELDFVLTRKPAGASTP